MNGDQAAVPVAMIVLLGVTTVMAGGMAAYVMTQEPAEQPIAAGFRTENDERLRLDKTAGDALDAGQTDIVVETPEGSARVQASSIPGVGSSWTTGESVCVAGDADRCLSVTGASEITAVRVVSQDQTLHEWTGEPETTDLAAGGGPTLAVSDGTDDSEDEDSGSPDLTVTDVTASPATPTEGEATTFDVTVENTGDAASEATSTLDVQVEGSTIDEIDVASIEADGTTTVTTSAWTATGGNNTVTATADDGDAVDEADESNNQATVTLAVASEDPGHAYEDQDNDALFTPGTDTKIPDSEIQDGVYHVQDPWSLVVPASVGSITASTVNYTAGSNGHVIVDVDLTTTDEDLHLGASSYVEATDVTFTSPDERINLTSDGDDVYVNASTLDSSSERVILRGDDVFASDAELTSDEERTIVVASGAADLEAATLDANERVPITAGADVDLTDATLSASEEITVDTVASATVTADGASVHDEDDKAVVAPEDATIEGSASHGEVTHDAGSDGNGGPP